MLDCDAIIATNWPSAYPVYNFKGVGKKYYYVQDFEPFFEPEGFMRDLAEQTYKFDLHGLTLGEWLSEKLSNEYGMACDSFDFGYDSAEYSIKNESRRKDILFYAQPEKARRGFELGIMALELFHDKNPGTRIHMFGSDVSQYKIDFPFIDHGILSRGKIKDLYNKCAVGLVLSFTNTSLTPLEMMASGCIPVMNDAYHNRKIKFSDGVIYAQPNPREISKALSKALSSTTPKNFAAIKQYDWEVINSKINNILIRDLT